MDRTATGDRLFLAAIPDAATANRIFRMSRVLKHAYGFTGECTKPDRLHVSLLFLGGLAEETTCAVCSDLEELRMSPFEVVFDRSVSFRGRAGNYPFVLIGDDGLSRLKAFRQVLGAVLTRRGLRRRANTNFTPHITLLYDAKSVEEHPVDPVAWTVDELVLIRSDRGHQHVKRWPLGARVSTIVPASSRHPSASQILPSS